MFKTSVIIVALIQTAAIVILGWLLTQTVMEVRAIPDKVDMLMAVTVDNPPTIVRCPSPCKDCPDNKKELEEIKKLIKTAISKLNNTCGYYYTYGR